MMAQQQYQHLMQQHYLQQQLFHQQALMMQVEVIYLDTSEQGSRKTGETETLQNTTGDYGYFAVLQNWTSIKQALLNFCSQCFSLF